MSTIIALATNVKNSSIAVIRLSGNKSFKLTEKLYKKSRNKSERILRNIFIENQFIDEVILNFFPNPHSFTGENVVEIMCHANEHIVNNIIDYFLSVGCVNAKPGEFLERAYLNKKVSLLRSQTINEIILAKNESVLEVYRKGLKLENCYLHLKNARKDILDITMESDVQVEYPEYEEGSQNKLIIRKLESVLQIIKEEILQLKRIVKLEEGYMVALIGKTNVGKSSLFNKLLGMNRAIVTSTPGTTTDYIKEKVITKNNYEFFLLDTAGFNKSNREIENIGIGFTKKVIQDVDCLINFSNEVVKHNNQIHIVSKSDQIKKREKNTLYISSTTSEGVDKLINLIEKQISDIQDKVTRGTAVFKSGKKLLLELQQKVILIIQELKDNKTIDIFRSQLEDSLEIINTLLGENESFSYYEEIFRQFCIGK